MKSANYAAMPTDVEGVGREIEFSEVGSVLVGKCLYKTINLQGLPWIRLSVLGWQFETSDK